MKRHVVSGIALMGLMVAGTVVVWTTQTARAPAHCQVPCGIYDDRARIVRLLEDTTTISKAIHQIRELSGRHDTPSLNQITRWIQTKENHASHIIEVVSQYFLTQKVKPVSPGEANYDAYLKKLADHHAVMVSAMKTKQQSDPATAKALQRAIEHLATHYSS